MSLSGNSKASIGDVLTQIPGYLQTDRPYAYISVHAFILGTDSK